MNFNTNQTRHFYVAAKIATQADPKNYDNLDIKLGHSDTGEMYFFYKNAGGDVTRTDSFKKDSIKYVTKTTASDLAKKLLMAEIEADTNVIDFGSTSSFIGKTLTVKITFQGVFDYDESNSITTVASIVGDATNLASAAAFAKYLAIEIAKTLPKNDPKYPMLKVFYNTGAADVEVTKDTAVSSLTGSVTKVKLVQGLPKYVRGKLSCEPVPFSVASSVDEEPFLSAASVDLKPSTVTGNTVVPNRFILADLEYFAQGERGDVYRGYLYPNDYEVTYAINPALATSNPADSYDVLNIEYFWSGNAENIQKSPRLLQIAAPTAVISDLYDDIEAIIAGQASS